MSPPDAQKPPKGIPQSNTSLDRSSPADQLDLFADTISGPAPPLVAQPMRDEWVCPVCTPTWPKDYGGERLCCQVCEAEGWLAS